MRAEHGDGVVTGVGMGRRGDGVHVLYTSGPACGDTWLSRMAEPLPADIPRERVADLHAAVCKRMDQLEGERDTPSAWPMSMRLVHAELSEVAEALRLLLEVDDGD